MLPQPGFPVQLVTHRETTMRVLRRLLACLLLLALPAAAHVQSKELNVYNWTDYIDPLAISRFQEQTGITVHYDVYDSLETLEAKMLAGHSGYDVIVPTNEPTFSRLIRAGALAAIDKSKVPNVANLDPKLMARVASSDPGNAHGAIYLWGSTGLGMIPDRIRKLAPDAPLDSWDVLFKPEYAKRIAACGITMMDSATDVIPSVLHYLGHSQDSTSPEDLADVEKALMRIRPYIRNFASGGALEQLATGQTCLVLDYSGDVIQAEARANEAKKGVKVVYVAPKEGAQVAFDMLAIPADAPHPDAALAFINFLLQPPVMAGITNVTRYPNAVPASLPLIKPEIANDPSIFPTPAQMATFFTVGPVPQSAERPRSRMWARFKAGR
jgi:putrescine transport system substrate-binding protein